MYVVYNKATTRYLRVFRNGYWKDAKYASVGAARSALAREVKKGLVKAEDYDITDHIEFARIEKTETVINLMSGKPVVQPVNTPRCCSVDSESYWSQ